MAARNAALLRQRHENLTDLANYFGSDKGTVHGERHAYSAIYDLIFSGLQHCKIRFVEIGLQIGGPELGFSADRVTTDAPSVRMWRNFFTNAELIGIDVSDFSWVALPNFTFMRADCGDRKQLQDAAQEINIADVIIDDGSHASFHQQLAFCELFPTLRAGGLYVIEDLHWQPKPIEVELPAAHNTASLFNGGAPLRSEEVSQEVISLSAQIGKYWIFDSGQLAALRRGFEGGPAMEAGGADASQPERRVPKLIVIEKARG